MQWPSARGWTFWGGAACVLVAAALALDSVLAVVARPREVGTGPVPAATRWTACAGEGAPFARGEILDRGGVILAASRPVFRARLRAEDLAGDPGRIGRVAALLGLDPTELSRELLAGTGPVCLDEEVRGGRLQGLRGLGGGVDLVEAWRRVYPYGEAACAVLGYVSPEGRGLDGVEYLLDTARAGGDRPIALNLDIGLQIQTERVLRRVSAGLGAGRGCFVVMDVRSGAVSAMANWPAWDPARFYATDRERLGNRSLRADVEPAGLLAALAWASGGAAPADLAAWAWRPLGPDVRVWGPWSGSALRRLGIGAKALETLWRFRLGQATGVDLPGEETGALPALAAEADLPLDKTGVRVSPLQMLAAFSALLDGGVLHRPRIAAETPDAPARVPGEVVRPLAGLFADRGGMVLGARVREGIRGTSRRDTWRLSLLGCWPPGAPRVAYVMVLDGIAPASEALLPPWPELGRIARYAAELPADETLSATGGANGPPAAAPRRMPDLRGKSFRVALRMLQSTRLQIRIEGRGRIADQAPRPGAPLEGVRVCRLVGGEGGR